MKNNYLKSAFIFPLLLTGLTSFAQSDKQTEKARDDVKKAQHNLDEAKQDLHQARIDSTADFIQFKKEAEAQIAENEKSILALQNKKWNHPEQSHEKYNKKIVDLRMKNEQLKDKIKLANSTSISNWSAFKKEFNHDLKELGKAIKDITINNVD